MSSEDSLSRRGSVMWEEVGKDYYTVQVFEKSYSNWSKLRVSGWGSCFVHAAKIYCLFTLCGPL